MSSIYNKIINDWIHLQVVPMQGPLHNEISVQPVDDGIVLQGFLSDVLVNFPNRIEGVKIEVLVLEGFFQEYQETKPAEAHKIILDISIQNLFIEFVQNVIQEDSTRLEGESKVLYLIYRVLEKVKRNHQGKNNREQLLSPDLVNRAQIYITENIDKKLTVAEIAYFIGTNQLYLKKGFKQVTGLTVYQFIQDNRMALSKRYIEQSNLTLSEIALKVGFSSLSSFSQAFSKYYGINPSHFIKTN